MVTGGTETEVKIRLSDADLIRASLLSHGFQVSVPRQFESNTLYDTSAQLLRMSRMLLRLREIGSNYVLTWKGPGSEGPHKSRPELESSVGSIENVHQILDHLGFHPSFRYEKYRTEFNHADQADGTVTLDETPIGFFMELEGSPDWIDRTAKLLGFSTGDYILDSYGKLYLSDCQTRGVEPSNMVFTSK